MRPELVAACPPDDQTGLRGQAGARPSACPSGGVRGPGWTGSPRQQGLWDFGPIDLEKGRSAAGQGSGPPLRQRLKMPTRASGAFPGACRMLFLPLSVDVQSTRLIGLQPSFPGVARALLPLNCWHLFGWLRTHFILFVLFYTRLGGSGTGPDDGNPITDEPLRGRWG